MWIFLASLIVVLGFFYLGSLTIFFADDITEWIKAKTDYVRAKTEALKKQYEHEENCSE